MTEPSGSMEPCLNAATTAPIAQTSSTRSSRSRSGQTEPSTTSSLSSTSGTSQPTDRVARFGLFVAFVATVYGANWALNRYGMVPIGFGLMAPAGVYFAGLALGLRDALQECGGRRWVLAAIITGTAASYVVSDAVTLPGGHLTLALASGIAFGLSELADLAIYSPLRDRSWPGAVAASNAVGAAIDSLVFLPLAFGSSNGWVDLTIGKLWLIPLGVVIVGVSRRAVPRYRLGASGA